MNQPVYPKPSTAERRAEKEIDAFLRQVNAPSASYILAELRTIT
jgi:hypothetical protein